MNLGGSLTRQVILARQLVNFHVRLYRLGSNTSLFLLFLSRQLLKKHVNVVIVFVNIQFDEALKILYS